MFAGNKPRQFQKGLDNAAARAKRQNLTLSLRRQQRQEHLQKKTESLSNSLTNQQQSTSLQLHGLIAIRTLLSTKTHWSTNEIISSNTVANMIQFMFSNDYNLAYESAWIITNISAIHECCLLLVKHGAINAFIHLLKAKKDCKDVEIITQAIWGLGNIAGDQKQFANDIVDSGICSHIIAMLLSNNCELQLQLFSIGMWAIHNFLRSINDKKLTLKKFKNKYNNLCQLIYTILSQCRESEILSDSLWCLCALTNNIYDQDLVNYIVSNNDNELINLSIKLLNNEIDKYEISLSKSRNKSIHDAILSLNSNIYRPCLRFIANILSVNDNVTKTVIQCGYLDCIEPFINHSISEQRREILWSISNIFAGDEEQIEHILSRKKLIRKIILYAINDQLSVRVEAIMCISNALVQATSSQKNRLAENGAINALCQLLNPINNINDRQIITVIDGLNEFLKSSDFALIVEECNGLNYLEARASDETLNENTYDAITNFMKEHWDEN